MPVAAIPAIVWASAAAGGASVAGAAIAAHGAKEAAKTQAQAGNNALGLQKQMFDQQQAAYAPYRQIGQSILPSLARAAQSPIVSHGGPDRYQPGIGGTLTLGALNGFGGPRLNAPTVGAMPMNANAPALVRMQAPDGSVRSVPAAQVQHYQSLGASVIGG